MNGAACPDHEQLQAYAAGKLAEATSDVLADHIDRCRGCQAAIATLDDTEDSLVARLRRTPRADEYQQEREYHEAVIGAKALAGAGAVAVVDAGRDRGAGFADSGQLGDYQLLEKLGEGGMGAVYKALHTKLERTVALKVLPKTRMTDARAVARFVREMKAVGRVDHPNVVRAMDAREIGGTHFLVMEYVAGLDLAKAVRRVGRLQVADACEIIRQAALGLQAAHQHGLVHRDIKPSNLMLTDQGQVKILDLGLAHLQAEPLSETVSTDTNSAASTPTSASEPSPSPEADLTGTDQVMGTLAYMAPEQVENSHSVDIRADIFSLGCTLYELLAARAPFGGPGRKDARKRMLSRVREQVAPIGSIRADVPAPLADVLGRMLANSPADRFAEPEEVARALEPFARPSDLPGLLAVARESAEHQSTVYQRTAATDEFRSSGLVGAEAGQDAAVAVSLHDGIPPVLLEPADRRSRPVALALVLFWLAFLFLSSALLLGVVVWINKTRIEVPDGSEVSVGKDGTVEVKLPDAKVAGVKISASAPTLPAAPFDAPKAKEYQQACAKSLGVPVEKPNTIGMKLVLIPPGEFGMGMSASEAAGLFQEEPELAAAFGWFDRSACLPQHRVCITKPFWLGKHEVTRAQFRQFVQSTGYKTDAERGAKTWAINVVVANRSWQDAGFSQTDDDPVVNVTHFDALAFCQWLSRKEGKTYRLPTEAEWEYACRAGTTTRFSCGHGESLLPRYAWFRRRDELRTHPAGQKLPNPWGLQDMHGNVWEWCADWFDSGYYAVSPREDPPGPTSGVHRVIRGGSFCDPFPAVSSAFRVHEDPTGASSHWGFRIACDAEKAPAARSVDVTTAGAKPDKALEVPAPGITAPANPVDLLLSIQPERDAISGNWRFEGKTLICSGPRSDRCLNLQIPYVPPDQYDLLATFERVSGREGINLGLVVGGRQCFAVIDGWPHDGHRTGLHVLDGMGLELHKQHVHRGQVIPNRKPTSVRCTVRRVAADYRVGILCDGREVFQWQGDAGRLALEPLNAPLRKDVLFLAVGADGETVTRISQLQLIPISTTDIAERLPTPGRTGQVGLQEATLFQKAVLRGHRSDIRTLAFSPNGETLASGSFDLTASLWATKTWTERAMLRGHGLVMAVRGEGNPDPGVNCVAFAPNGRFLATAGLDSTARLWDTATGSQLRLVRHVRRVLSVAVSPKSELVASGDNDGMVKIWRAETGEVIQTFQHATGVECVAFNPVGDTFASASWDGAVILRDTRTWKELTKLTAPGDVRALAFAPNGKMLAVSTGTAPVLQLWDLEKRTPRPLNSPHRGFVYGLAFSPDGAMLASAGFDGAINLWDAASGELLVTVRGHAGRVWCVGFSPDGTTLASGGSDATIRLWDVTKLMGRAKTAAGSIVPERIPASPVLEPRTSGGTASPPRLATCRTTLAGHTNAVVCLAVSPRGDTLASASRDGTVKLWDPATGKERATLTDHQRDVICLAFSKDGLLLASGSDDRTIIVRDAKTLKILSRLVRAGTVASQDFSVVSVAFSPDGKMLASSSPDATITLWDLPGGRERATLRDHSSWVWSVVFSPDGKSLASASFDGTVKVWDVESGSCRTTLPAHKGWAISVDYSPDGKMLASGGSDHIVRLWDLDKKRERLALVGHTAKIERVRFSGDGTLLATAAHDGDNTARIWDAASGQLLEILTGHEAAVHALAFSPDGKLLATGSADQTIRLWDVSKLTGRSGVERGAGTFAVPRSEKGKATDTSPGKAAR